MKITSVLDTRLVNRIGLSGLMLGALLMIGCGGSIPTKEAPVDKHGIDQKEKKLHETNQGR